MRVIFFMEAFALEITMRMWRAIFERFGSACFAVDFVRWYGVQLCAGPFRLENNFAKQL